MLQRLLTILQAGGLHTVADLAQMLGTSPVLVEAMLEDLSRRGYLQAVAAQCVEGCVACPFGGSCRVAGNSLIWSLTGKGAAGESSTF